MNMVFKDLHGCLLKFPFLFVTGGFVKFGQLLSVDVFPVVVPALLGNNSGPLKKIDTFKCN